MEDNDSSPCGISSMATGRGKKVGITFSGYAKEILWSEKQLPLKPLFGQG
jgi:hypothetical protein